MEDWCVAIKAVWVVFLWWHLCRIDLLLYHSHPVPLTCLLSNYLIYPPPISLPPLTSSSCPSYPSHPSTDIPEFRDFMFANGNCYYMYDGADLETYSTSLYQGE